MGVHKPQTQAHPNLCQLVKFPSFNMDDIQSFPSRSTFVAPIQFFHKCVATATIEGFDILHLHPVPCYNYRKHS
jgi:hypothetical protein